MLVNSIDILALYIALDENMDFDSIANHFALAERSYLKPLIGAFLNTLDELDSSSGSSAELNQALKYAQAAVAYFGMYKATPNLNIKISGNGYSVNNSTNQAPASQWRVDQLRAEFLQNGYESLDAMLAYMEENAAKLEAWKDSEARKALLSFVIPDPLVFDSKVKISASRMTFEAMRSIMSDIQEIDVKGILTEALYLEYVSKLQNSDIKDDFLALHSKLQPAVANLTIAAALKTLPLKISNQSLVLDALVSESMKKSEDIEAQQPLLRGKIRHHEALGKKYLAIAENWLLENTSKFTSYALDEDSEAWENTVDSKVIVLGGPQ